MQSRKSGARLLWLVGFLVSALPAQGVLWAQGARNSSALHVPDYMLSLYRSQSQLDRTGSYSSATRARRRANTVTSFVDISKDRSLSESHQQYVFDLTGLSKTEELVEAELRVFRKPPLDLRRLLSFGGSMYHLKLYRCFLPGSLAKPQLLSSRTIDILDATSSSWDVFNVRASVNTHRRQQRTTQGSSYLCFCISVVSDATNEAMQAFSLGLGWESQPRQERALLVAFSHARKKDNLFKEIHGKVKAMHMFNQGTEGHGRPRRRRKRRIASTGRSGEVGTGDNGGTGLGGGPAIGGKGAGKRRTRCSRKPLHVNFKELGWDDWIIAPLDYDAYHCEGACDFPLRSHLEPTNHAIIQTLMNSMDSDFTPPSCCVPSKLSPISILYIDAGNNVVYKQYEDMVVESCGCR